jgi:hypothetical protein
MEYDMENDPAVRPRIRERTGGQRNTISFEFKVSYRESGSVRLSREKLRCVKRLNQNGGDDGTRTRGLCRDRAAF